MTIAQTILGARGGDTGIYMSRAGVDVFSAADSDMIINSSKKEFQFLMADTLFLGNNESRNIVFPYTLQSIPVVMFQASEQFGANLTVPCFVSGGGGTPYYIAVTCYTDHFNVTTNSIAAHVFRYAVLARGFI